MAKADSESRTFVEFVLTLLESRFPWLGSEHEESSGADTVAKLNHLHEDLIQRQIKRAGTWRRRRSPDTAGAAAGM
jgi:hypothetical protein